MTVLIVKRSLGLFVLLAVFASLTVPGLGASKVTLVVHSAYGPGRPAGDVLQTQVDRYNTLQDRVEIEVIVRGSTPEMFEWVMIQQASGNPTDIIHASGDQLDYWNMGLVKLPSSHSAEEIRRFFFPGLVEGAMTERGEVMGYPGEVATLPIVYYTPRMLAAGLNPGTPATYQELREWARKLTSYREDGTLHHIGFQMATWVSPVWGFLLPYVVSEGGSVPTPSGYPDDDYDLYLEALEFLVSMVVEDRTATMSAEGRFEGRVGLYSSWGPWEKTALLEQGENFYSEWGSGPQPAGSTGESYTVFYESLFLIGAHTEHTLEVETFLHWLTMEAEDDGLTPWGEVMYALGQLPSNPLDYANWPSIGEPFLQGFLEALQGNLLPLPVYPGWINAYSNAFLPGLTDALAGTKSPHAVLQEYFRAIEIESTR